MGPDSFTGILEVFVRLTRLNSSLKTHPHLWDEKYCLVAGFSQKISSGTAPKTVTQNGKIEQMIARMPMSRLHFLRGTAAAKQ